MVEKKEFLDELGYKVKKEDLTTEVITLIALKKPRDATELIMEAFLKNNYVYSTRDDDKSEMWIYNEGIYVPHGSTYIKEFCGKILGRIYTTRLASEVVEKIRVKTYIELEKFFETKYVFEVPILKGILNIKTREVSPFDPKKIFFNKIPLNYDPKQKCPLINKFFDTILQSDEDKKVMFEIFGFLLLKDYKIEKAAMFNGEGRNGKSKTLSLMEKFVGGANTCNVPISAMKKDNFDLEDLFGKMLNSAGDVGKTSLKDTGCFKELTGRDGINLPRKFKRSLRFVNYAKHVFACNDLPIVYDNTDGFWTKWIMMDFIYKFITQEEIDALPEAERKNKKLIDIDILEKIATPKELNGLLNEALDGLDRLLKQKDFSYSQGTNYIKKTWQRRANSFLAFCEDCVEEDETKEVVKTHLRRMYGQYCKKLGLKNVVNDKVIKYILENDYFAEDHRNMGGSHVWRGVKLKDNLDIKTRVNQGNQGNSISIGKLNAIVNSNTVVKMVGDTKDNNSQRELSFNNPQSNVNQFTDEEIKQTGYTRKELEDIENTDFGAYDIKRDSQMKETDEQVVKDKKEIEDSDKMGGIQ